MEIVSGMEHQSYKEKLRELWFLSLEKKKALGDLAKFLREVYQKDGDRLFFKVLISIGQGPN